MPAIDLLNSLNQKYSNTVSGLTAQNVKTALDEIALRNLGQFSTTTSAQLANVISDETGSGSLVFGTSPTLSNPVITGGSINNTPIGATTANTGAFTTISATGNITTAGDLTVNGGDIVLGGTGRIQGIDSVIDNTDAVNKQYVEQRASRGRMYFFASF